MYLTIRTYRKVTHRYVFAGTDAAETAWRTSRKKRDATQPRLDLGARARSREW